jgi:uncharacterized lipoprotein YehR (DUF1307 family)
MRALATIVVATATLFILSGCGEEEKKRLKAEILNDARTIIDTEVKAQVAQQMRDQLPVAVEAELRRMQEEYARRVAEQQAQQAAAKTTAPAATTTKKKTR